MEWKANYWRQKKQRADNSQTNLLVANEVNTLTSCL